MRPLAYLAWTTATMLVLATLAVALTVIVNPYDLFATKPIAGWTALKPRADEQAGMAKIAQLERVAPKTLLLGNSRVEIGFDPESAQWPKDAQPVFNAAEAGTSLMTAWRRLQDSIAIRPPRTVIVGLDFPDFMQAPTDPATPLPPPGADERRLLIDRNGLPNAGRRAQQWRDRLAATLTIDALYDSIATLADQNAQTSATMTERGFNPLREYTVLAKRVGYYGLFAQKNEIYSNQYSHATPLDYSDTTRIESFRYLDSIIRVARENQSRLILFIHPYHAQYLDILRRAGLWPSFDSWKQALARTVAASSLGSPGGSITLLDFSGYNDVSTEPVPPEGDFKTAMRWYWESGHYKSSLGDKMIKRFFDRDDPFGVELTPAPAVVANNRTESSLP